MANLKQLAKEAQALNRYVSKQMPLDVSRTWLWTAQNAFLTETDPQTGKKWEDRYGLVFGSGFKKAGNVESYLNYKKLHRTGKLFRGLKVKRIQSGNDVAINLYNRTPYAKEHEEGGNASTTVIKPPYLSGGAAGVVTGGEITKRSSMQPSEQVLNSPQRLVEDKIKSFGW